MEMRTLGNSGINVSAIGLGLMSMSGIYGNANDDESIRVIHYALEKGINFLDSADMYGWGHNETLLGRALKGRRQGVIVGTKFGQTKDAEGKQGVNGKPEYVSGEITAFGAPWTTKSWSSNTWDDYAWQGSSWTGSSWSTKSWSGMEWSTKSWSANRWTGSCGACW